MARPWLSVLMPVHNGANYLRVAMDSILLQRDSEIEVIALDDGSTDETPQILEAYRDRLNLVVRRRDPNGDWPSAVNCAMGLASGKYQCWLHHDDAWEHGRLAVLKDYIARWPEAVMVLHPSWFMSADGRRFGQWRCPLPSNRALEPAFVVRRLLVQNFAAAPAPLYKSQVVTVTGRLDERLWYTADWDFWLRVTGAGPTVYCPTPLAWASSPPWAWTLPPAPIRTRFEPVFFRSGWPKPTVDGCGNNRAFFGARKHPAGNLGCGG